MSDYSELERRAQAAIDAIGTLSRARQEREFNDACTPQVVKALIADLDEARNGMKHSCAIRLKKQIEHLEGERDRLRAEVAGLKTGYEAYERVNAELKAKNERLVPFEEAYRTACNVRNRLINEGEELRKALAECGDSLQGEMLQKFGGQLPEDMHPVTRRDYDRDMAELAGYRAAIGKGEQS